MYHEGVEYSKVRRGGKKLEKFERKTKGRTIHATEYMTRPYA